MHIILNKSSMIPIYEQLVDQLKNEIINGSLASTGMGLPISEVSAKLASGESTPTNIAQRHPRRHPPMSTGRYIGSS